MDIVFSETNQTGIIKLNRPKVLNALNFEIYDPSLICIEILGYREMQSEQREKEIKNNEIFKFLVDQGYKKVWSGKSYCSHLFSE